MEPRGSTEQQWNPQEVGLCQAEMSQFLTENGRSDIKSGHVYVSH